MATNPMQRKARNSFLLGMLTMLLIASVIIALLFIQLLSMKNKEKQEKASYKDVYVVSSDIKSGENITATKLKESQAAGEVAPSNLAVPSDITSETVAKINLKAGTVLTKDMINQQSQKVTSDLRKQELNMVTLPTQLQTGDWIDIRLRLPSGQDYIVVSKKSVTVPQIGGVDSEDTIWVNMSEDEILTMSNALVEAYIMKGAELYAATYVDPGMQDTATPTYPVSAEVMALINSNPNIVEEARKALWARYNTDQRNSSVNRELQKYSEESKTNIEESIQEQITKQKETRKKYLDSLSGATDTTVTP